MQWKVGFELWMVLLFGACFSTMDSCAVCDRVTHRSSVLFLYSYYFPIQTVSPRAYLPVQLIEGRIAKDLCANLMAIRKDVTKMELKRGVSSWF